MSAKERLRETLRHFDGELRSASEIAREAEVSAGYARKLLRELCATPEGEEEIPFARAVGALYAIRGEHIDRATTHEDGVEYDPEADIREYERARAEPIDPRKAVEAVLRARLAVARITAGKVDSLLRRLDEDGRMRDGLAYWAAGTGRWGGRGFQPQNLPRTPPGMADTSCDSPDDVPPVQIDLGEDTHEVLGGMLRGVLCAPPGRKLAVADFASIEARILCWIARDEEGLNVFRWGEDAYVYEAARIYGGDPAAINREQRKVGKVVTLALGYQGGVGALERMANAQGLDASTLDLEAIVQRWRDAHPLLAGTRIKKIWRAPDGREIPLRVGGLWRAVGQAAADAVAMPGAPQPVGLCEWICVPPHLRLILPSGRTIHYRHASLEVRPTKWETMREQLCYASARGERTVYGGLLVENMVQAIARDVLADVMLRLDRAGHEIVLHVHDEVVVEVDEDRAECALSEILAAMRTPPAWAPDLPLDGEGYVAHRYA